jgi:hypothetical protein
MADKDIATRAPENDAQDDVAAVPTAVEQSIFPGDSRAQDGPSMGVRASYLSSFGALADVYRIIARLIDLLVCFLIPFSLDLG